MDLREEVNEMRKELDEIEEESFAMLLLKDYKKSNAKMFKIIIMLIVAWFLTILGIILYSCLPTDDINQEANGHEITQEVNN